MRGDLFPRLLQLGDGLLAGLVKVAEIGLQTLTALALFAAEDQLDAGVFTLAKGGIQLCGKVALLSRALALKFGDRRIHFVYLLIQLGEGVLGFAQLTCRCGDRLFLLFELREQGGALLLLLTYRPLFSGDIGLNGFKLVALVRLGGCRAQQYASAEHAGVK